MCNIGCARNGFHARGTLGAKLSKYLVSRLTLSANGAKRASTWTTSPWRTIGCVKKVSMPVVHLAQTMHLSCAETNTISKRTEISFHLTYITSKYHQVCPKPFPYPWYIQRKPCNYLVSRLKLSPNGLEWAFTWFMSPWSIIRCV
jgi:hypothetical protein